MIELYYWIKSKLRQSFCSHRNCFMDPTTNRIDGDWFCQDCGKNVGSIYGLPSEDESV